MNITVNEKVKVVTLYDPLKQNNMPLYVHWRYKRHAITNVGYHHKVRYGRTMMHIYHVNTESVSFRLRFDSDTLIWYLESAYVSTGI